MFQPPFPHLIGLTLLGAIYDQLNKLTLRHQVKDIEQNIEKYFLSKPDRPGMSITGYATSRSRSEHSAQLLAQVLTTTTQEMRSVHTRALIDFCLLVTSHPH